jgi:multiple sugar transport system permease protein
MILPAVLYVLALVGFPFCLSIYLALSDAKIASNTYGFVGLENIRSALDSPTFRKSLGNTLIFTIVSQVLVLVLGEILATCLTKYLTWIWNTVIVGALVVLITLALALPAGYALARLSGKWGERLGIAIFLTYLVPSTLLFIPMSRIVATLGLQDTLWALVVVYPSFTIPFCVWLLMGFFKSIPKDIEEAAMVDGCSRARAIVQIIMPISLAGILSAIIFAFTLTIQEFTYALTFITSSGQQTVGVGVPTNLVRGDVYFWGSLMAGCLITSIPVAILYNLFLDRFISGFTVGAIK